MKFVLVCLYDMRDTLIQSKTKKDQSTFLVLDNGGKAGSWSRWQQPEQGGRGHYLH